MSTEASDHLGERAQHLLKVLVEHYLADGQPVGSRTLSRDCGLSVSPATIRNIMSDLEDLGFIHSPHVSSGRIPTVQGYRFFIDSLLSVKPLEDVEVNHLKMALPPNLGSKALVEKTSLLLTGITDLASVVSVPKPAQAGLKHIEFIALQQCRVLVVMVMAADEVQNRVIQLDKDISPAKLLEYANYINSRLADTDFLGMQNQIIAEMVKEKETVNTMMLEAIQIAEQAIDIDGDCVFSGEMNLMDFANDLTLDKVKHLLEVFHQKQIILGLLDQCLHAEGIQIFIGNESGYTVLNEWSVVTAPYSVDGKHVGVLGVIGPTRMAYDRVIPIVDITARLLGSALQSN